MKKTLLIGIAALFLATGAAHATCVGAVRGSTCFRCGNVGVIVASYRDDTTPGRTRADVSIENLSEPINMRFKITANTVYLNGKHCKEVPDTKDLR